MAQLPSSDPPRSELFFSATVAEQAVHRPVSVVTIDHGISAGRAPNRCTTDSFDPPAAFSVRVIVVYTVVIPAQGRQIGQIRLTTVLPGLNVVHFAGIRTVAAAGYWAHEGRCSRKVALLLIRQSGSAV